MILLFVAGFFLGALSTLVAAILLLFNVFGKKQAQDQFPAQIPPNKTRIPTELKAFLRSAPDGNGSEWESCSSMSLLLHFLFQEHKDTRQFRRWLYKKLQLELNDVTARSSAAGRIIQGIQIRDLEAGTNSPVVKDVRVEAFRLAEDDPDMFEELVLLLDLEYHGGFQMSVDALMAFGKFAQLSVKLLHLSGRARVTVKRQPFAHWSFSFVENPQMELKIESQFQGRNLRHLIPLIGSAFRKVLQLKHVWPNYKLRFRPLFQNPLWNPSPNFAALEHIGLAGTGLEVTVLSSSRLNTSIGTGAQRVYCKVFLEKRPYGGAAPRRDENGIAAFREASHLLSVLLAFSRKGQHENLGVTFSSKDGKEVRVERVEAGSNAEKCGFRKGDCLVAVNNIPVRNERQASRLLTGTAGDLLVLVEREMESTDREPTPSSPSPELPSASSKLTESAEAENFDLPDTPPMEIRARDEPEQELLHWSIEQNVEKRKSFSKEEPEALEMLPITPKGRRPTWLQKTSKWESSVITPISVPVPSSSSRIDIKSPSEEDKLKHKKKGKKAILKHIARRGNSFRAAKLTRQRRMRRSRSESSLVRMEAPEVMVEELERKWDESVSVVHLLKGPDETTSSSTDAPDKASISTGGEETAAVWKEADKEKHYSKRERFQTWVEKTLDKTKPILSRRKPPELAVEANDEMAEEQQPCSSSTMNLLDKPKEKKKKKKSKSPSPSINNAERRKSKSIENSLTESMKRTKAVPFSKNPIWGQSLHFCLQRESLYLNLLVYAEREDDDLMLGYTSVYVPRVVDDCTLTLSNCHRERFHLKGPKESEHLLPAELEELNRHNGFDSRLCFGDLLLGFRFFPEGLPNELGIANDEAETVVQSEELSSLEQMQPSTSSQSISPPASQAEHKWISLHTKIVGLPCGLCGAKIWLKGTRCERCHLLCHHSSKCQERARTVECKPNPTFSFNDDSPFEELDPKELVAVETGMPVEKPKESVLQQEEKRLSVTADEIRALADSAKSGCRRRRIADNIREKIKNVGDHIRKSKVDYGEHIVDTKWSSLSTKGSESPESPILQNGEGTSFTQPLIAVSEVLDPSFLASLEGFPAELQFSELRFEPGNAYNPTVICEAKQKGQHVFGNYAAAERKARINGQIDRVQAMIEKVTRERRSVPDKNSEEFDQVDNRLQALALIMLLYCSGLSDCVDKEEEEENLVASNGKVDNAMENGEIHGNV